MQLISRMKIGFLSVMAGALMTGEAGAVLTLTNVTINFDEDAFGNPLSPPDVFSDATRLSDLYSPIGITFVGPGGNDGGAILDKGGNFGIDPLSGNNFLAFNTGSSLSDGGIPKGPEFILFGEAMSKVSIYASGGNSTGTFLLEAFDINDAPLSSVTATGQQFTQLIVQSPVGIRSVRITETSNQGVFLLDDLEATLIPEPSVSLLTLLGLLGLVQGRSRR